MTDRALPYYKWYWQDWRSNRAVQRMGYVERGLYRELLDECWVEGGFPDDFEKMADICGCPEDVIANAWQVLSKHFFLVDGFWQNEKLDSLRTERDQTRLARQAAGRLGGIAKTLKNKEQEVNARQDVANASKCHIEEESREENNTSSSDDLADSNLTLEQITELYHHHLPQLPAVRMFTPKRRSLLKARMKEYARAKELEWWDTFFEQASLSRFLTGGSSEWRADLDFLLSPKGFLGVIEGKYK